MSEPAPARQPTVDAGGPLRAGDAPAGLFWGMSWMILLAGTGIFLSSWALQFSPVRGQWGPQIGIVGVWFAILIIASILQSRRQIRWDAQGLRTRLEALRLLTDAAAAIGTEDGAESFILRQLPQAMRAMLGMDMACIGMLEDDGKIFHIAASDGIDPLTKGQRFPLDELLATRQCVLTQQVVAIEDIRNTRTPVNKEMALRLGHLSMLEIPLLIQGKTVGVLMLGDRRPRAFTPADLNRAWLWGCQASLTIANSRLYASMGQSLREQKRLIEHRNALYALNTAIQRPGGLPEILQRIADLAPGPLEVDTALVWLVNEENPQEMILGAVTFPYGEALGNFRLPARGSITAGVLARRKSHVIEDGDTAPGMNPHLCSRLPHGSLLMEPLLRGDGTPLGSLVLARRQKGPFHRDQLELADLFSKRVAAVIEMARLYQQTRHDADAKAMLLRELNHRVKNNLAGIVSLLSIDQPQMNPDAVRWLNRAIDRISAMAQVHDLFSDGRQRVRLGELMERTVRSLSVIKPPEVAVRTELPHEEAWLRTDRAVSLAMAIHELSSNGIVHALAQRGTLTIRARRDNGDLAVEIEDDAGRDAAKTLDPAAENRLMTARKGIGLTLVRGLVARELRGEFTLAAGAAGTVARLHFPLLPDELRGSEL